MMIVVGLTVFFRGGLVKTVVSAPWGDSNFTYSGFSGPIER